MSYYDTVYSDGDSSKDQKMFMHLYPFSSVTSACKSGGTVATALKDAGDQLLTFGHIDYYEVLRFKTGTYNPPDGIDPSSDFVEDEFKDYLKSTADSSDPYSNNGTQENLYSIIGSHQLIHDDQNPCDETGGGAEIAPDGVAAEPVGDYESTFTQGLAAWSPVCSSNDSLTKNAAIQECLHTFIAPAYDDQWTGSDDDQHSLGMTEAVDLEDLVTPMLTYHWDESKSTVGEGSCPSTFDDRTATGHQTSLTECTRKALGNAADNELPEGIS